MEERTFPWKEKQGKSTDPDGIRQAGLGTDRQRHGGLRGRRHAHCVFVPHLDDLGVRRQNQMQLVVEAERLNRQAVVMVLHQQRATRAQIIQQHLTVNERQTTSIFARPFLLRAVTKSLIHGSI